MFDSYVRVEGFEGINFIPFHKFKKENNGIEPYVKTISVGVGPEMSYFKFKGMIYALKITQKNDLTKMLCVKVENPVTIRSADGSITGNCAKGVKDEYISYITNLVRVNFDEKEIFKRLVFNIDKLK